MTQKINALDKQLLEGKRLIYPIFTKIKDQVNMNAFNSIKEVFYVNGKK